MRHFLRDTPRPAWVVALAVAGITGAAFWPVLDNGFVNWDDQLNLTHNIHFKGLAWPSLKWMLTSFHLGHYIPLTWISLGFDYCFWGLNPAGYHLTSLMLHCANAVFLYWLIIRLLEQVPAPETPAPGGLIRPLSERAAPWAPGALIRPARWNWPLLLAAACGALFWAIHPLRVEPVAWATGRRYVLSGFFSLLSLHCHIRKHRPYYSLLTFLFYAAACFSHEICVSLLFVYVILDFYPLNRASASVAGAFPLKKFLFGKIHFIFVALFVAAGVLLGHQQYQVLPTLEDYGPMMRLAHSLYAVCFYLKKTFFPLRLSGVYEIPKNWNYLGAEFLAHAAAVAAVSLSVWFLRKRAPYLLAAWLLFLGLLLPTMGIPLNVSFAYDRFTYHATLPFAVLAGAALARYLRTRQTLILSSGVAAICSLVIFVFGGLSMRQTRTWRDSQSFWNQVLAVNPLSYIAHFNLGQVFENEGDGQEALRYYQQAHAINSDSPLTFFAMARVYQARGNLNEALRFYREALTFYYSEQRRHPTSWSVVHDDIFYSMLIGKMGRIFLEQNLNDKAIHTFFIALKLNPDNQFAHYDLARAYIETRQPQKALSHLEKALALMPDFPEVRRELKRVRSKLARFSPRGKRRE